MRGVAAAFSFALALMTAFGSECALATHAEHTRVEPVHAGPIVNARIDVFKSRRELQVHSGATLVRAYRIGLGLDPRSPKRIEGDRATPEGRYVISHRNPRSRFLLSLAVSYPNDADADRGLHDGLISEAQHASILAANARGQTPPADTPLGGEIFVHGNGSRTDWTWGCIALDDADMRLLYEEIAVGTPIVIHP